MLSLQSMNSYFVDGNSIGSITIRPILIKNLLRANIIIPDGLQRVIDLDTVKELVEFGLEQFRKNGELNISGTLKLFHIENETQFYLLDGQHRWCALQELYSEYGLENIGCFVEIKTIKTKNELREYYEAINKNTKGPDLSCLDETQEEIVKNVAIHFKNHYNSAIWTKTIRNCRPKINFTHFQEAIAFLVSKLSKVPSFKNLSANAIIGLLKNYNNKMAQWPIDKYKEEFHKGVRNWDKHKSHADKYQFYLGLYQCNGEDYCYEWVKNIFKENGGHSNIHNFEPTKRKRRSRKKKDDAESVATPTSTSLATVQPSQKQCELQQPPLNSKSSPRKRTKSIASSVKSIFKRKKKT